MFAEFMDLRMAVVAPGNAIMGARRFDLIVFQAPIFQTGFFITGLEKTATAAATVIIGAVRDHIDKIFFSDNGLHDKTKVFRNRIAIALANDLAGILNRKFYFQILIPVGIDIQFSFTNPFGVVFIDVFNFKLMRDIEFFQSCQD